MFSGLLRLAQHCPSCKLSFNAQDTGDGPVFFALIIVGFISVGIAGYIELRYEPAWWVHVVTFVPITLLLTCVVMRFFKAWLIALQYQHRRDTFTDI